MKNWYVRNKEEHLGPYSTEDLKLLGIYSNDFVWKEGLADWTKAGAIQELKEVIIPDEHILIPPDATLTSEERYVKYLQSKMSIKQFLVDAAKSLFAVFKRKPDGSKLV